VTAKRPLSVNISDGLVGRVSDRGVGSLYDQVKDGIDGIKERIAGSRLPATPVCYIGSYTFAPESATIDLDVAQAGGGTSLVNYIVRSGVTYQIPINVGGDGVFRAHAVRCVIRQRFYVGMNGIKAPTQMTMAPMVNAFNNQGSASLINWTTKFSLYPNQPAVQQSPSINYRWNLQDLVSGVMYSDELIPSRAIMNRTFMNMLYAESTSSLLDPVIITDGGFHQFCSPWEFEQAQQVVFMFRPLTDVVQYDSSLAGNASPVSLDYDDRENNIRNQSVTVQVELLGERIGGSQ
jgi:hypothetical protein